ncbi:zinc ribbon domain-containing protein [Latilactobacillus graminis]|uniref:Zinc-ribbon domain-containing protein n=2 Tax=Latilactobacillus graminis TaxID=60519 RepID=A0AA89I250_9LACO|nr:zinc ribbon domain-containing protein [Latilactobacillus graminis]KRM24219.1 hypothetical protein FC90_GL000696 [Latilactobacillus graminis DSM 20719]QFP78800.1 zinc-ribbon domain-containing protein [Latilactobacillus graminis]
MQKYCANCGTELSEQAKFCTNCGQKQPTVEEIQRAIATKPIEVQDEQTSTTDVVADSPEVMVISEQREKDQVNEQDSDQLQQTLSEGNVTSSATDTLLGLVAKDGMDVGPLMRERAIIDRKIELGYSDNPDNFVYVATPIDWSDLITIGGLTGMKSQHYIMSFEADGILLMGCIGMMKFNDDNHFIKNSDVTKMDIEKYPITNEWDHMYLEINNQQLELLVQRPTFSVIKWHRRNFKKVLTYTM